MDEKLLAMLEKSSKAMIKRMDEINADPEKLAAFKRKLDGIQLSSNQYAYEQAKAQNATVNFMARNVKEMRFL